MSEDIADPQQALDASLAARIHSASEQDLLQAASSPDLSEDLARALFQRRDLNAEVLAALAQNGKGLVGPRQG